MPHFLLWRFCKGCCFRARRLLALLKSTAYRPLLIAPLAHKSAVSARPMSDPKASIPVGFVPILSFGASLFQEAINFLDLTTLGVLLRRAPKRYRDPPFCPRTLQFCILCQWPSLSESSRPERNLWLRCLCLSSTGTTGSPKKRTFGSLPNALLRFPYPPLNDHVSFRSVLSIATQTDLVLWRLCRLRTISTASLRENNVRILTKGSACPWNLRFRILRQGPIFSQKAPVLVGGIRNFGFRASFRRAQGL